MSALDPMTADKTAAVFSLPVDAVKEAIAYDQRKPPEIGQDCEQEERVMEASGRGIASGFATSG